jgi:type IV secretory pathway VirB10-like protein
MSQLGTELLRYSLDIQATIIIRPGQVGTIMVNKDIYLKP